MSKFFTILGLIIVVISCQIADDNTRMFVFEDSESIKSQIQSIEQNLLPAIYIQGNEIINYSLTERMQYYGVPGVSIAVINDYKVIWAKGYGLAEIESTDSVLTSTMFQAASLSKPVTSIAVMQHSENGDLSLDKPVNSQLTNWLIPNNEYTKDISITPRMLLLHTSGLNVPGFSGYTISDSIPNIIEILSGSERANNNEIAPTFNPGSRWSYSGGGYIVLQLLLEEITNKPFPQLMNRQLFETLDLKNSTFEQPLLSSNNSRVSKGHTINGTLIEGNWRIYPELAAAGLWTTPYDLASIVVDLQNSIKSDSGRLLKKETTEEMLSKHFGSMGLGFLMRNEGQGAAFTFNGGNAGYRCDFFAYRNGGSGAVIMTNSDNGQRLINEIYRAIAQQYGWADYNQEIIVQKSIIIEELSDIESEYITYWPNGEEYVFSLKVEDGRLHLVRNDKIFDLVSTNNNTYREIENGWTFDFNVNSDLDLDSINCFIEFGNALAVRKE